MKSAVRLDLYLIGWPSFESQLTRRGIDWVSWMRGACIYL